MLNKALLALFTLILLSCTRQGPVEKEAISPSLALDPVLEEDSLFPEPAHAAEEDYLTIIAVGDNLYHNVMVRDGEQGDYGAAYIEIRSLVQSADIAFINQETLLGGREFGFTGWPLFNSPQSLGRALAALGFNVVSHANNHVMDRGERALNATMEFWDTIPGVMVLGIHPSPEARNTPVVAEINNFRIGFLAYTYGTNSLALPPGRPYMVSLIDREVMAREINALRPLCDFLVVSMHWGNEYQHNPSINQRELADFLAEHQVDLVIGHHPHVIQPIEYILRPDGRFMLCFFSLGNFISAQATPPTMLGIMAYVKIRKIPALEDEEKSSFIFVDDGAIPLVTHFERGWTNFKVYPLYSYSVESSRRHWMNRESMIMTVDYLRELSERILGFRKIKQNPFN